jgi:hypothetical protein
LRLPTANADVVERPAITRAIAPSPKSNLAYLALTPRASPSGDGSIGTPIL